MIAALHANAPTPADTDWPAIAAVYARLERLAPSPVVTLNRAVAVAMADGPRAGLAMLEGIDGLDRYHLLHAARAELLARAGDRGAARASFRTALALAPSSAERRHLSAASSPSATASTNATDFHRSSGIARAFLTWRHDPGRETG